MANNVSVKDSGGNAVSMKTTDSESVHTPHHYVDGIVHAQLAAAAVVASGAKTAPTDSAAALGSSTACYSLIIRSIIGNSATIYVGGSGVTVDNGFPIEPGESLTIDIDNVADIYCISGSASQVLRYLAVA